MSTKKDVLLFLTRLKIIAGTSFDLVWTEKNKAAMVRLGYTGTRDILPHIFALTVQDYVDGPCPDRDTNYPDPVWIFAPTIEQTIFYVKLKIIGNQVRCLSFHEAGKPIGRYPFRENSPTRKENDND
ncbi:hypothetical protein GFC01_10865 [Desulfofundulus thermobenzoicus]|uniref:Toxin n=1 Tax=Desulfofundulus thermobenzoicus TaxID=29376 RepID=A0A6N7IT65_9FIRM|nr:hypothetical protein [Desulfofundulus thermobenzoicus]MQL52753.1 hypothetical protein [Desulfofundulus thermobenzoicus]